MGCPGAKVNRSLAMLRHCKSGCTHDCSFDVASSMHLKWLVNAIRLGHLELTQIHYITADVSSCLPSFLPTRSQSNRVAGRAIALDNHQSKRSKTHVSCYKSSTVKDLRQIYEGNLLSVYSNPNPT